MREAAQAGRIEDLQRRRNRNAEVANKINVLFTNARLCSRKSDGEIGRIGKSAEDTEPGAMVGNELNRSRLHEGEAESKSLLKPQARQMTIPKLKIIHYH